MTVLRRLLARWGWHRALLALDGMTSARKRAWRWLLARPKPIHPQQPRIFYVIVAVLWLGWQLALKLVPHSALLVVERGLLVVGALSLAWLVYRVACWFVGVHPVWWR